MKKALRLLVVIIGVVSLSSCGFHIGNMNNSASLSQANFDYVKTSISGEATSTIFIAFGGNGKKDLVEQAKADMLKGYKLKPNQALANITVNWRKSFYLIVFQETCTVTADIVEFK